MVAVVFGDEKIDDGAFAAVALNSFEASVALAAYSTSEPYLTNA